jgi:hypothetical protein
LGLAEAPSVHSTTILSTLTVPLTIEGSNALDVLENYCCSPLDCEGDDCPCGVVEKVTGSSGSPLSIPGGYRCSYSPIVPCEGGDDTHSGVGYSHTLREIIVTGLLVVSNREITKITVHTYGGDAFYHGSVAGDAEAQSVLCEGERPNLDSWLRYDL